MTSPQLQTLKALLLVIQQMLNSNDVKTDFNVKIDLNSESDLIEATKLMLRVKSLNYYGAPIVFKIDDSSIYIKVRGN